MAKKPVLPYPTDSELAILQVLWRKGPSSVRDIWSELGRKTGYTSVLKLLQIMLGKNLVRRDERALSHVYESTVPQRATEERLVSDLLERAFASSASQLMLRALSAKPVSASELKSIRALLTQAEGKRP